MENFIVSKEQRIRVFGMMCLRNDHKSMGYIKQDISKRYVMLSFYAVELQIRDGKQTIPLSQGHQKKSSKHSLLENWS